MSPDRTIPHHPELEESLLGVILSGSANGRNIAERLADRLENRHWYNPAHGHIWASIVDVLIRETIETRPEARLVAAHLEELGLLDQVGGITALEELAQNAVPLAADNAIAYARRLIDAANARVMLTALGDAAKAARSGDGNKAHLIVESVADELDFDDEVDTFSAADAVADTLEWLDRTDAGGIPTGITDLDAIIGGLEDGRMYTVAGRPAMGKSAVAATIVSNIIERNDRPVIVFSMEMGRTELIARMASARAQVSLSKVNNTVAARSGRTPPGSVLTDDELEAWLTAAAEIATMPLTIVDQATVTPTKIAADTRKLHRQHGIAPIVVIDYLGLVENRLGDGTNRQNEVSETSRAMKKLARSENTPVVVLSQLSRNVENRSDKRPVLADLRDSGAIEQDSDVVIFVYRDEVYHPDTPDKGVIELIVSKQRNGPIGTAKAVWIGHQVRVANAATSSFGPTGLDDMAAAHATQATFDDGFNEF